MKKLLSIFIFLIVLLVNAQTKEELFELTAQETCDCMNEVSIKELSKNEMHSRLGICMINSYNTRKDKFLKFEVSFSSENAKSIGDEVGIKMAAICPEVFLHFIEEETKQANEEVSNEIAIKDEVDESNEDEEVTEVNVEEASSEVKIDESKEEEVTEVNIDERSNETVIEAKLAQVNTEEKFSKIIENQTDDSIDAVEKEELNPIENESIVDTRSAKQENLPITGLFIRISGEELSFIHILDQNDKYQKFMWLSNFKGSNHFIENVATIQNVQVYYRNIEYFVPNMKEYYTVREVVEIKLIK